MKTVVAIAILLTVLFSVRAQKNYVSKVWVADNGDGTYKNPVLYADYSDPDAIRVGDDYYLLSSSFEDIPGLPGKTGVKIIFKQGSTGWIKDDLNGISPVSLPITIA